jgi:hypothetical protein
LKLDCNHLDVIANLKPASLIEATRPVILHPELARYPFASALARNLKDGATTKSAILRTSSLVCAS